MITPSWMFRDNFDDNLQAAAWSLSSTIGSATKAETVGEVRFTLPSSVAGSHLAAYQTPTVYDMTGDGFTLNVTQMVATGVAATAFWQLYTDPNNGVQVTQLSGTLKFQKVLDGVTTDLFSATWSATTHKYWRIHELSGTISFDTSTNGTSWTNRASVTIAASIPVTALGIFLGASCGNVASPGSFRVDDFNTIMPALTTNWHYTQVEWPLLYRFKSITLAATSGQGYIATSNDGTTWTYYSGPIGSASGGYLALTVQSTQAAAEAMAVNMPLDGRWDLPAIVECRFIRLYHRSTTGSSYTLREYYPRRLVQSDDIEAESIKAINIAANSITADKIFVLNLAAISANIGQLSIDTNGWIYQGTGTGASPTTGLKLFNSGGIGKLSGYNATVEQITLDTDGRLKAGAGNVILDVDGITMGSNASNYLMWKSGSNVNAVIASNHISTMNSLTIVGGYSRDVDGRATLYARGPTAANDAFLDLVSIAATGGGTAYIGGGGGANFKGLAIQNTAGPNAMLDVLGSAIISGGINVGTATGAAAGDIAAANSTSRDLLLQATGSATYARARLLAKTSGGTVSDWRIVNDSTGSASIFTIYGGDGASLAVRFQIAASGATGFFGSAGTTKPTVTGSRGGNAALASLLTALANLGLLTDSST